MALLKATLAVLLEVLLASPVIFALVVIILVIILHRGTFQTWISKPGFEFQDLVYDRFVPFAHVSSPSPLDDFFLVVSFSRSAIRLDNDSAAPIFPSVLRGLAAEFRVVFQTFWIFRFLVSSKNIGLMIHWLDNFVCKDFALFFSLWRDGGPDYMKENKRLNGALSPNPPKSHMLKLQPLRPVHPLFIISGILNKNHSFHDCPFPILIIKPISRMLILGRIRSLIVFLFRIILGVLLMHLARLSFSRQAIFQPRSRENSNFEHGSLMVASEISGPPIRVGRCFASDAYRLVI